MDMDPTIFTPFLFRNFLYDCKVFRTDMTRNDPLIRLKYSIYTDIRTDMNEH